MSIINQKHVRKLILAYLGGSAILTAGSGLRMEWINRRANDVERGRRRIRTLMAQGRFRQVPLFGLDEIEREKKLGQVRLSVFPRDEGPGLSRASGQSEEAGRSKGPGLSKGPSLSKGAGQSTGPGLSKGPGRSEAERRVRDKSCMRTCRREERRKFAIICPGGGYAHLCTDKEGYAIAARMNELGYTCFVLEYRTGFAARSYAPTRDLARAICYVTEHADAFDVDPEDYALIGFSAGGNLVGLYGTERYGWKAYGTAKPGAIIMGYPWTNINHWMDHPYWNIWKGLIGLYFTERSNLYYFGWRQSRAKRDSVCVQKWITEDFPPCYMFSGAVDVLTPASHHADVMAQALEEKQVPCLYRKYFRLPHGIGLGIGTQAEGWLSEAVDFWERQTGAKTT